MINCIIYNYVFFQVFSKIENNCCYNILFWNKIQIDKVYINRSIPIGTELIFADPVDNIIYLYNVEITNYTESIFKLVGKWDSRLFLLRNGSNIEKIINGSLIEGVISVS